MDVVFVLNDPNWTAPLWRQSPRIVARSVSEEMVVTCVLAYASGYDATPEYRCPTKGCRDAEGQDAVLGVRHSSVVTRPQPHGSPIGFDSCLLSERCLLSVSRAERVE